MQLIEDMLERDPLYRPAVGNGVQVFNNFGMPDRAQALLDQFAAFDPNDPQLLQSRAFHRMYQGRVAEAYADAERAIELAPTDSVARFVWSVALLQSGEIARLAEEGQEGFTIDALYAIGERDKAFEVAERMEEDGYLDGLFRLLVRSGRGAELTDYVEERWPSLEAFAADYTGDGNGYPLMLAIAQAYRDTGKLDRFDEAMIHVDRYRLELVRQEIDNFVFDFESAKYFALAGDTNRALDFLGRAVDAGMQAYVPIASWEPALSGLQADARFAEIEARMLDNINNDRVALGMEPIDPYTEFWQ